MTRNVQAVIDSILAEEGGIADVGDGKGVTRFGQTPAWLEDNGFVPPSNAGDAAVNYATWLRSTGLGAICDLDVLIGQLVVDYAVHAGLDAAVKALQRALGVRIDGALGPVTLAALAAADGAVVAHRIVGARARLFGELLASSLVDRRKYARGWASRLARQIELLA